MRDLKHSGRRAFLRGLGGVGIGLPLLEYTHGRAWAGAQTTLRFLTVFDHGGTVSNQAANIGTPARFNGQANIYNDTHHGVDLWRPLALGPTLQLGPIHEQLEPWRSKLLLLEGIDNLAAVEQDPYGRGDHGISNVTAMTAADMVSETVGEDTFYRAQGPSIDQVIADRLAARQPALFDRIHLLVAGHEYGTPFFRGASEPVEGEPNPIAAWMTLFSGVDPNPEPSQEFLLQQARRGSTLDSVIGQFERFKGRVSARDLQAIEAHLDHLRALEQEVGQYVACTPPPQATLECSGYGSCYPRGSAEGVAMGDVVGPMFADMIIAAIRCGLTNVAVLEIADILTPWTPAGLQVESGFGIGHSLGHYAMDVGKSGVNEALRDAWLAEMLDNRRWRMGLFARILAGLDDPTFAEGDRTILDNSLLYYTSEFRGANHIASNVMALLAGSAGGSLETGKFIDYNKYADQGVATFDYESKESIHNLYTTFLHALGENDAHFGNANARHEGPLPGLV